MATKTAVFNMRVEEDKKNNVEQLYKNLGMTLPQAVNMFFTQSLLVGGLPFEARMPRFNRETEDAMQEAREIAAGRIKTGVCIGSDSFSSTKKCCIYTVCRVLQTPITWFEKGVKFQYTGERSLLKGTEYILCLDFETWKFSYGR